MDGKGKAEGVKKLWDKYKFAALVMLIGAVLLLWPSGSSSTGKISGQSGTAAEEAADIQREMEDILGKIAGVGQVQVMLTLEQSGERQLAQDGELSYSGSPQEPEDYSRRWETVMASDSGEDAPVVTRQTYPVYRGALVVCQGGNRAEVCLAVTEAVTALTGLSADRVTVAQWQ